MTNGDAIKVVIGIVTCNHHRFIAQCLNSVRASCELNSLKVVVVDNCSSDRSAELIRDQYPWVELIERDSSHSFSNNNNVAFATAPSEYFLMLNPDTVLEVGAVDTLVGFMNSHSRCGICGPKLVFPDGSLQYSCRRFPTMWSTILRRTPFRALLPKGLRGAKHLMASVSHDNAMSVDWMLGACLLVRRTAIMGTKLLDEGFPLYCEEIDLCLRLKHAGWTADYIPNAKVVHHHLAKSDYWFFCRESLLHAVSMIHFMNKHYFSLDRGVGRFSGVNRCPPSKSRLEAPQST